MFPRTFLLLLAALMLCAGKGGAQDVRLTEFQALNAAGIKDEDGTFQPWVELWNPSTAIKVTLTGWTLSNGTTTWPFPAVEILPDERIIVWASGKNRSVLTAPLHTSFTLPAGGGTLTLKRADTTVASQFLNYLAQTANTSWGREESDAAAVATVVGRYATPTPGERNNYSGSGVAGKVAFGLSSRAFSAFLSVALTQVTPDAGAVIRYTLDGNVPTAAAQLYANPLTVNSTVVVRARVFKTGLLPGETETQGYVLLDGTTTGFTSAMPMIVLTNFSGSTPPDTGDQPSFMWVWEPAPPDNRSHFTDLPTLATRTVLDRRGSSTLMNPKHNVNVEARRARDDEDHAVSLLGFPDGSDFVFTGPYEYDRTEIHNPFIYALSNGIGRYAPAVRNVEVFFDTNGGAVNAPGGNTNDYFGIYNVVEKIRRDKNRVNVTKLDTYDNDAVRKTGGYLWKVDRLDAGDGGFSAGGQSMAYYYPKELLIKSPQRDPQEQYLTTYINNFNAALQSGTWNNPTTGYAAYIDVPEALDHHLLNVWPMNVDGLRLSGYWHKERGGKMIAGPVWDFDRTMFCATDVRTDNPLSWRATQPDFGTDFFNYPWWGRMFQDIDFYQKYIDRWQVLRRGAWSQANVEALIDSINAGISAEAINRDVARWGKTKRAWTRPFAAPNNNTIAASQAAEIQRMKDWLQQRAAFFDSQWIGPVSASVAEGHVNAGTTVTLTGPAGATIYYTLNGADPRPSGGGLPGGVLSGTAVTINATTRVRARAFNGSWLSNGAVQIGANNPPLRSAWGGLTNVRFATDALAAAGNLVVTEINFHPVDPTAAELAVNPVFADKDFEFLELKNIGPGAIDLGGAQFTAGVAFTFSGDNALSLAPGAFVVVAANPAAFAARYGAVATVVGPWAGDLDNGGEELTLKAAGGATILDFFYDDAWFIGADGGGYTLVLYDPLAPFGSAANWRQSAALRGSPGANDPNRAPTPDAGPDVVGFVTGVALAGTAGDDRLPAPPNALSYAWSQLSGPGAAAFNPPNTASTTATFSLPGTYILRLTVSDSALAGTDDFVIFAKDTPAAWLARHPGIGTLDDDFDGDGRTNLIEFALGTDPAAPDAGTPPTSVAENGHLTLTYPRIKPISGVTYAIEVGDQVTAFRPPNSGEITEQILTDDGVTQTVKVTDSVFLGAQPGRFIRLKITTP